MDATALRSRYLDLLKRAVEGSLDTAEKELRPLQWWDLKDREDASWTPPAAHVEVVPAKWAPVEAEARADGSYEWFPRVAHSLLGRARLDNLQYALETVLAEDVPGDVIETGVWRGGAMIFARGLLDAHGATDRVVWCADSFEGLPAPTLESDAWSDLHTFPDLAVSVDQVRKNFAAYGLLDDDRVKFVKGWFKDTLPGLVDRTWSVVRLDGDLYESTINGLDNLYPGLSPNGFLIVDDYGTYEACAQACHDYRERVGETAEIVTVDKTCVYWRKS